MAVFLEKISEGSVDEDQEKSVARLAIYDNLKVSPRVIELSAAGFDDFISLLASKAYQSSQEKGGSIPFTVIKEVVENLIHAYFKEITITILDEGNTIRISDQGPGIQDKNKVMLPGFSTATSKMRDFIKGVGSGLPVVKESISFLGGTISVDDNIDKGTVITLRVPADKEEVPIENDKEEASWNKLTDRQRKVLFLVTELGSVGPSRVASELSISLSTAFRDLALLEKFGLIKTVANGKRALTSDGLEKLDHYIDS